MKIFITVNEFLTLIYHNLSPNIKLAYLNKQTNIKVTDNLQKLNHTKLCMTGFQDQ